jgi:hypothetical protein
MWEIPILSITPFFETGIFTHEDNDYNGYDPRWRES